jgi:sugar transferase EpsL
MKNQFSPLTKRLFDILIAAPVLLLFSPGFGLLALLVRFKLGTPVLFRQQRPGLNERTFTPIKFRTMTDKRVAQCNLLPGWSG